MDYFQLHPKQDLPHGPVVDWVEEQYFALYHKKSRDTWRAIRNLSDQGRLIKVKKGIYRYDPDLVRDVDLYDFTAEVKEEIFSRDSYRCIICGRGRHSGVEITADHIKPRSKGGSNTVENGQTLCTEHNLLKKNYSQTETGKRYFTKIYNQAIANHDLRMINFCKAVFDVYDEYGINGHIDRPNGITP